MWAQCWGRSPRQECLSPCASRRVCSWGARPRVGPRRAQCGGNAQVRAKKRRRKQRRAHVPRRRRCALDEFSCLDQMLPLLARTPRAPAHLHLLYAPLRAGQVERKACHGARSSACGRVRMGRGGGGHRGRHAPSRPPRSNGSRGGVSLGGGATLQLWSELEGRSRTLAAASSGGRGTARAATRESVEQARREARNIARSGEERARTVHSLKVW